MHEEDLVPRHLARRQPPQTLQEAALLELRIRVADSLWPLRMVVVDLTMEQHPVVVQERRP